MQKAPAFAVLRFDDFLTDTSPEDAVTVVKVMLSKADADAEAARLNEVNAEKDCRYWVQYTRLMTSAADKAV